MASSPHETIARLSAKPGVQATLVLSRKDGAVIQSSGFPSTEQNSESNPTELSTQPNERGQTWKANAIGGDEAPDQNTGAIKQRQSAEEAARAVFNYVADAGRFADSVKAADDVQLLRLRTKKQEIVIVPDQNYLMVVFQDISKLG